MATPTALDQGRAAYADRHWSDAVAELGAADEPLAADDLTRLATSAFMLGQFSDGIDFLTRAHEAYLAAGDMRGAVRAASWNGLQLMQAGERSQSAGWFARADRLVQQHPDDEYLPGMPMVATALGALFGGDPATARQLFTEVAALGQRFADDDLIAIGLLGQGQAAVMSGDTAAGVRLLDEAMVAVTAGEVSPLPSGIVYCAVIDTCHLAFDVRRALEWTRTLDRWCDSQPDLVAFSGECQAHRAALYRLHGVWPQALAAAQAAEALFRRGDRMAGYDAFYERGEVHRLRGEFDDAQECFREAGRLGYDPQPGLALLYLAIGNVRQARSLIMSSVDAAAAPGQRSRLLPALAEIQLAAGDVGAAREAADELAALAEQNGMPLMLATAAEADGAVLVAEDQPSHALTRLRGALLLWRELDAPYEEARTRMLMGRACRELGDEDSARMEFDAARSILTELGARPSLAELDSLVSGNTEGAPGPLTGREIEVLRLVSAGLTNRDIAGRLYLSEKTVARHLSNIFMKLSLPSRAAATAYAYEHQLVT